MIPARLLAEEVQVRVTANAAQTPEFGWFPDSGHQGGQLMIFRDGTPPQNWVSAINKTTQAVNASENGNRPVPKFEHNLVGENAVRVKLSELISQSAEVQFLVTGMAGCLLYELGTLARREGFLFNKRHDFTRPATGCPLGIEVAASAIDQNPYLDVESFINTLEDVSVKALRLQSWEDRVAARLRISLQWLNAEQRRHWALLALFPRA